MVKYAQSQDGGQINATVRPALALGGLDAWRGAGAASPPGPQSGAGRSESGSAYESTQQPTTGGVSTTGLIGGISLGGVAARGGAALGKLLGEKITNLDELKKLGIPAPGPREVEKVVTIITNLDTIATRRAFMLEDALAYLTAARRPIEQFAIMDELAKATISVFVDDDLLKWVTLGGRKEIQVSVLSRPSLYAVHTARLARYDALVAAAAAEFLTRYDANASVHQLEDFNKNRALLGKVAHTFGLPIEDDVLHRIHWRAIDSARLAQYRPPSRQYVTSTNGDSAPTMTQNGRNMMTKEIPSRAVARAQIAQGRTIFRQNVPSAGGYLGPTMIQRARNIMLADATTATAEFFSRVHEAANLVKRDLERAKASHEQLMKARGFVTKSRAWTARATQYGGAAILGALGAAAGYGLGSQAPVTLQAPGIK